MDSPGAPRIRLSTGRGVVRRLRLTGLVGAVLAIVLAMPPMRAVASTVTRQGNIGRRGHRLCGWDDRRIQRALDLQGGRLGPSSAREGLRVQECSSRPTTDA